MPTRDHKTKDFLKKIDLLIERGVIKNHAEVVTTLNWNKSVMSSVKNGQLVVPQHIYNKFKDTYSEQLAQLETKNPDQKDQDYQAKYIALLEKKNQEQEIIISKLTAFEKVIDEIVRNQFSMYAIQASYMELTLPILGNLGQKKAIQKEAALKSIAYLEKFQKEGIVVWS